jgi:D-aminoacyl-tRNA deacylase
MIALLQRVAHARVDVGGATVGSIEQGLLMLVCAEPGDTTAVGDKLLAKVLKLRIFSDDAGKMNRSLQDVAGGLLIVSQFTLAADTSSGTRPGFSGAAAPELARGLFDALVQAARLAHPGQQPNGSSLVQTGQFAAHMQVHLLNDGPVTIPMRVQALS